MSDSKSTRQQRRQHKRSKRAATALTLGGAFLAGDASAATITVNSNADNLTVDSQCTLREALQNANQNAATNPDCTAGAGVDTVFFSGVTGTIALDPAMGNNPYTNELYIIDSVTVQGPGRDVLSISGENLSRVVRMGIPIPVAPPPPPPASTISGVAASIDVTISGLTITNGAPQPCPSCSPGGAGVLSENTNLTMTDARVTNNNVLAGPIGVTGFFGGPPFGGGIASIFGGSLALTNVEISNNFAFAGGGVIVLSPAATATFDNVQVTNNGALVAGAGIGALVDDASSIIIRNSVISGNETTGLVAPPYGPPGGTGVAGYYGPPAQAFGAGLSVNGAAFSYTYVQASSGRRVKPSGIPLPATLLIEDTTISGNTTTGFGGGLYVSDMGQVTVRKTTISGNSAVVAGGGMFAYANAELLVENSTIADNVAGQAGGGLLIGYTTTVIEETTISGNSAAPNSGSNVSFFEDGAHPGLIENSIVANGLMPDAASISAVTDADIVAGGTLTVRYSLVETPGATPTFVDGGNNIFNQDPQLGALADNGGLTLTMKPASTSPVVNAGDPAFAPPPATDQRDAPRVSGGVIDMGSVELNAGTVQLSVAAASVAENAGFITITATRTGGSDGAVTVPFTLTPGTATATADYNPAGGVFSWADGDTTPKTFNVAIVNDTDDEPDETFTVTLGAPTGGATLGAPAAETVTIVDDDEPLPVAQIPTLGFLMKMLLILGAGATGVIVLGRGRLLVYLLALCLAMAAAPQMRADQLEKKPRTVRKRANVDRAAATVQSVQVKKDRVTLKIAGETFNLKRSDIRIRDMRTGRHFASVRKIEPGMAVVFKVRRNEDGSVRRLRVTVFDSMDQAKAVNEQIAARNR